MPKGIILLRIAYPDMHLDTLATVIEPSFSKIIPRYLGAQVPIDSGQVDTKICAYHNGGFSA
jgi:hypothetical protein